MNRREVLRLAATGLVVTGLVGGLTYAWWDDGGVAAAGTLRTGDLDVELVGAATWQETSADVAAPRTVATLADGVTADHLATPGDTLTLTQRFVPRLDGDNLAARLTVAWDDGYPGPGQDVTATYRVQAPRAAATAPVPVGTAVVLPAPPDSLTPAGTQDLEAWTLVVTLEVGGTLPVVAPGHTGTVPAVEDAAAVPLGGIRIELAQVRDGEGFTS